MRQLIVAAIKTRLALIRVASDYNTDIGRKVTEWRSAPWQDIDVPGLDVRDTGDTMTEGSGTRTLHRLQVEILAMVKGDQGDVPTQMRGAIADLMAAIGTDSAWGLGTPDADNRHVTYSEPLSEESTEVVQDGKRIGAVKLVLAVNYITNRWEA